MAVSLPRYLSSSAVCRSSGLELPEEKKMSVLSPGEPVIAPAWILHGSTCPFRRPLSLLGFSSDELVICPTPAAILIPSLHSSASHPLWSQASLAPPNKVTGSSCGCTFLSTVSPVEVPLSAHCNGCPAVIAASTCSLSCHPTALIVSTVLLLWA